MKPLTFLTLFAAASGAISEGHANEPEDIRPEQIREVMARVADWQIAHPSQRHAADWANAALYTGMAAWAKTSNDAKYWEWLKQVAEALDYQPYERIYHADDHCVGWLYQDLYERYHEPRMLEPIKARFDYILANPSGVTLKKGEQQGKDRWWWCDALFMAPPVLARLSTITGDARYVEFMKREWWATTEYLYDPEEHLFYRDDRFFTMREENGRKIFWSRGNGWVLAGIARVLDYLPADHSERQRYINLYKEMASKLIAIQQADGSWHASLLNPPAFDAPESSGTGFFCYGLAWGVNCGILDAKTYAPPVLKAWHALVRNVHPDGKLGFVQPIGGQPVNPTIDDTDTYGVGALLYAGSEVSKMVAAKETQQ